MTVTHFAVDLRLRRKRRYRVHHDHINRCGLYQLLADCKRLFAAVRLGDDKLFKIDAYLFGISGIKGVLRVNERGHPAGLLRIGNDVQSERRLSRRFMTVAFDYPPFRQAAHTERHIKRQASGRNRLHVLMRSISKPQNRHLTEFLADQLHRIFKRSCYFVHDDNV